jgi:trans-aconitate methyltransferase
MATYDARRGEMLQYLPPKMDSLLDVGCASGRFLRGVRQRFPSAMLWGIDPVAYTDESDEFRRIAGRFPDDLPPSLEVDCVVFNDVLEHLVDPWAALRSCRSLLTPAGTVVASIPNIRNYKVLRDLAIFGRFQYAEKGILDKTHLRFFTKSSILELFEDAGLRITSIDPINLNGRRDRVVNRVVRGRLDGFLAFQYAVVATPSS